MATSAHTTSRGVTAQPVRRDTDHGCNSVHENHAVNRLDVVAAVLDRAQVSASGRAADDAELLPLASWVPRGPWEAGTRRRAVADS